jgi:tRNA1Val (adenine37-N6)-methyltransferase
MKVGTDAVLLGAWADATQAKRVLDIGTGTGILALMIAQKSEAQICAIDIDIDSYQQAIENIHYTLWKDRIQLFHSSIQEFSKTINEQFDFIITNPPYFTDAYKAKEISRNNARHTDELPFKILIECVCKLLQPQGVFYIILPFAEAQIFKNMAKQNNLCLVQSMRIKTKADKEPKRLLMKYSFEQKIQEETEIVIENDDRHHYTKEYIELTKDYYLDIDKQK